jgi:hypothetical protein
MDPVQTNVVAAGHVLARLIAAKGLTIQPKTPACLHGRARFAYSD